MTQTKMNIANQGQKTSGRAASTFIDQKLKIEDIHFKALTTSFNLIPNLSGLDRAPLSYDPITEPGSEKIFFKQMYVVRSKNYESKK